jgi:hypothetical protein
LRFLLSRFFFFLFVFVCPPFFFEDYLKAGTVLTTLAADYDLSQQPESFFKQKLVSSGFFMSSIGSAISSFVATGNFQAKFCSDLQQETGFVILAEKAEPFALHGSFPLRASRRVLSGNEDDDSSQADARIVGLFVSGAHSRWRALWIAESFGGRLCGGCRMVGRAGSFWAHDEFASVTGSHSC